MKGASQKGGIGRVVAWFRQRLTVTKIERAAGARVVHSAEIRVTNPWHAVAITSSGQPCCQASHASRKIRFLSREAPVLPLRECTDPKSCRCTYKHFTDRRAGPRRSTDNELYKNAPSRPVLARLAIEDRRRRGGRRATDAR